MTINQTATKNSRADRSVIGQKIAEVQHHVQRQDIADPDDLRLGVVEARCGMGSLQRREQHACRHSRGRLRFVADMIGSNREEGNEAAALRHRRLTVNAGEQDRLAGSSPPPPVASPGSRMPFTVT